MSLLSTAQLASIRALGEQGMTTDVTIAKYVESSTSDESNPFGAAEPTYSSTTTTVKGWLLSQLDRTFSDDGLRIVAVHDMTLRVPVGTDIESRDKVTIAGVDYTVMESNTEDTWPEWTEVFIKKST
jgi:hypothetical protein